MRAASPLPLKYLPISVLSSSARLEPGVFGIFRPVLLLPDGLSEHLTQAQFDAIIAHELCHVRRRDNLTFAIHMMVEALFWFYPLVRWIGIRLIEERERACDEAVLRMGSDPQDYAEGIVTVCKFYLKSPLACVSGVTGSGSQTGVETIMLNRVGEDEHRREEAVGCCRSGGADSALDRWRHRCAFDPGAGAAKPVPQLIATSALPEFEVASIKPSAPDSNLKVDFAPGGKLYHYQCHAAFSDQDRLRHRRRSTRRRSRMDRIQKIRSGGDSGHPGRGRSEEIWRLTRSFYFTSQPGCGCSACWPIAFNWSFAESRHRCRSLPWSSQREGRRS